MLLKQKLFLANCDSVRKLSLNELKKRLLIGLIFTDGVILSTNIIIDNPEIIKTINDPFTLKYLREEGFGKLIIRSRHSKASDSFLDYFQNLPNSYIFSSLHGAPRKDQLDNSQIKAFSYRLESLDTLFKKLNVSIETINDSSETPFGTQINRALPNYLNPLNIRPSNCLATFFKELIEVSSRSESYHLIDSHFANKPKTSDVLKAELIDPTYNKLFIKENEAFTQDNIKYLEIIPNNLLHAGVAIQSLRSEIELIQYPIKAFDFISALGAGSVLSFFTEEAIDFIENKMTEKGFDNFTRKNWFGMYERMTKNIGIEIK